MNPTYLITGVTGHLGLTLAKILTAAGEKVRGLILPNDSLRDHVPKQVDLFIGDVCDKHSLRSFFAAEDNSPRILLHTAGIISISSRFDEKVHEVNVNGTKNVISLCEETGVSKTVYVSSVHAIAEPPDGQTIYETTNFTPKQVIGLYAKTKAEATSLVLDAAKNGLNAIVVHPSGLLGPNDYGRGHLTQLLLDYESGRLTAYVDGGYDFVDVRDVASGILSASLNGVSGECYILSGKFFKVRDLIHAFQNAVGKRRAKTCLPMWFVRLTAPLCECYYRLRKQPPLFTSYSLYTLRSNANFSHEKAEKFLNYHVRPLEETVKDAVEFLRECGRMPQNRYKKAPT